MTKAFTASTLATLLLLALTLALHRCGPSDAAGCGMEKGFLTIIVLFLAVLVGMLALLFRFGSRRWRYVACGLLLMIAIPVALQFSFMLLGMT